jgi:hypothetical protein
VIFSSHLRERLNTFRLILSDMRFDKRCRKNRSLFVIYLAATSPASEPDYHHRATKRFPSLNGSPKGGGLSNQITLSSYSRFKSTEHAAYPFNFRYVRLFKSLTAHHLARAFTVIPKKNLPRPNLKGSSSKYSVFEMEAVFVP